MLNLLIPLNLLFLISAHGILAQSAIIGNVVDENRNPIAFANIYLKGKPIGTTTDERGFFSLDMNDAIEATDSLMITHISYEVAIYPIHAALEEKEFRLKESKHYDLAEIELQVATSKNQIELGASQKSSNHFIQNNTYESYQIAALIKNTSSKSGYLKAIKVYISGLGNTDDPIRIKLYDFDSLCNCPGQLLLKRDLLIKKVHKGWNTIKLSEYYIDLPADRFFVVYEWLFSKQQQSLQKSHALGMVSNDDQSLTLEKIGDDKWHRNKLLHVKHLKLLIRVTAAVYDR